MAYDDTSAAHRGLFIIDTCIVKINICMCTRKKKN